MRSRISQLQCDPGQLRLRPAHQSQIGAALRRSDCTVSPNAQALLNAFVPLPNNGVTGYVSAPNLPTDWRQEQIRVDQNIGQKTRLFVRYTQDAWDQTEIPAWGSDTVDSVETQVTAPGKSPVLNLAHSFKPNLMNEVVVAYSMDEITAIAAPGPSSPAGSLDKPAAWTAANLFPPNKTNRLLPGFLVGGGTPFFVAGECGGPSMAQLEPDHQREGQRDLQPGQAYLEVWILLRGLSQERAVWLRDPGLYAILPRDSDQHRQCSRRYGSGPDGAISGGDADGQRVPMVDHTIRVLEAFPNGDMELSLKETSFRAGVGRTSTLRILCTLAKFGYIHREPVTGRYRLGPKVIELGLRSLPARRIVHAARPYLQQLFKQVNETVSLAVLQDGALVYVESLESSHAFRMAADVGSRAPLHSTALGKSIAAFLPEDTLEALLERCAWTRFTPHTVTSRKQFLEVLNEVRNQGYSLDNEESEQGACCVATPILDQNQQARAAVSIAGPTHRIRAEQKLIIRKIKVASAAISRELKRADRKFSPLPSR